MRIALILVSAGLFGCFNPDAKPDEDTDAGAPTTGSTTLAETSDPSVGPGTSTSMAETTQTSGEDCPGGSGCACDAQGCDAGLSCVLEVCTNCGNGSIELSEQCDGAVEGGECQSCQVVCSAQTHAECDGDPLTCESLQENSDHCGTCGHGCLGAACGEGLCEPIVLADNLGQPLGIETDGVHVFWADQGTGAANTGRILSHPVEPGGELVVLAEDQGSPEDIALDSTHVYWGNFTSGGVFRVAHDGTGLETLLQNEPAPKRFVLDGDTLYWTRFQTAGAVLRSPIDTPASQPVTAGQPFAIGIAVDGNFLYWTSREEGVVRRADPSIDPVVVEDVATGQDRPVAVVVADGVVYWVNEGTQASAFLDGSVRSVPVEGGDEVILAADEARPSDLVVDDTHVYWVNRVQQGAVRRFELQSRTVEDLVPEAAQPGGIAQDDEAIYYTEQMAGRVLKVAK